jgi:hypothetical protein
MKRGRYDNAGLFSIHVLFRHLCHIVFCSARDDMQKLEYAARILEDSELSNVFAPNVDLCEQDDLMRAIEWCSARTADQVLWHLVYFAYVLCSFFLR